MLPLKSLYIQVCDYTRNCDDNEDEEHCQLVEIPHANYNRDSASTESAVLDGERTVSLIKTKELVMYSILFE